MNIKTSSERERLLTFGDFAMVKVDNGQKLILSNDEREDFQWWCMKYYRGRAALPFEQWERALVEYQQHLRLDRLRSLHI